MFIRSFSKAIKGATAVRVMSPAAMPSLSAGGLSSEPDWEQVPNRLLMWACAPDWLILQSSNEMLRNSETDDPPRQTKH